MAAWEEMALVGRIARAHGNRGQVIVDPVTDFPDQRFSPGSVLYIRRAAAVDPITIDTVRFHRGRPILGLAGVMTMDEAEALAGAELRIAADALQPLPPGSFYQHDLVGCAVQEPDGGTLGRVARVEGDGSGSRLVVEGQHGEVLIPLAEGICVEIDVTGRRIVVALPEGLLDLNATRRQRF